MMERFSLSITFNYPEGDEHTEGWKNQPLLAVTLLLSKAIDDKDYSSLVITLAKEA